MQDHDAIRQVVQLYLDGLYDGHVDHLRQAFHPTANLTFADGGAISITSRDAWCEAVANRPSPRAQNLSRHDEIVMIDQSSPVTAFVKLNCAIPPRFFTDYLNLLKIDGRWQIVQKIFAVEVR